MDDADLRARFNSIMTKGATYKFALAKFMLEYTDKFTESQLLNMADNNQSATVDYSDTAMEFLKYYWHQECKYRIRQNSDPNKLPYVISIIRQKLLIGCGLRLGVFSHQIFPRMIFLHHLHQTLRV